MNKKNLEVCLGWQMRNFFSLFIFSPDFRRSLSIVRPKEETLSRHSILGPNGLNGHWQPPRSDKGVWNYGLKRFLHSAIPMDADFSYD